MDLVCLNVGWGTRVNVRAGTESAIDLTLVSNSLAGVCSWEVFRGTTVGSDHYPIVVEVNLSIKDVLEEEWTNVCFFFFWNCRLGDI